MTVGQIFHFELKASINHSLNANNSDRIPSFCQNNGEITLETQLGTHFHTSDGITGEIFEDWTQKTHWLELFQRAAQNYLFF